jgi:hypothetical protein
VQTSVAKLFAQRKLSQQEAKRAIFLIEKGEPPEIAVEEAILGPPLKCLSCGNLKKLLQCLGVAEADDRLKRLVCVYEAAARIMATLRVNPQTYRQKLMEEAGVEGSVGNDALKMLAEKGLVKLSGDDVSLLVN